jgi:hypothetical protein
VNQTELLRFVVDQLEDMGLRYFITGSIASISYGEARFTNDIDIVVDLPARRAADLCRRFPDDQFYVSEDAALDAARGHGQFNIIHPASGLKIDIIVPPPSEFTVERFVRAVRMPAGDDSEAVFSSAEDIILSKMLFYREGKSDKHLRDIAGIIRIRGERLDQAYIEHWARRLGLEEIWQAACERVRRP